MHENLRHERKVQGFTALDMANELGIAESSYFMKESESRPFMDKEIAKIVKKLNKPFEYLFNQNQQ